MPRHRVVALVDDEPGIQDVVQRALRRRGDAVKVAKSLAEGRTMIFESDAAFDCAIIDIMLPDGKGLTLANEAHARLPDLRITLTTGGPEASTGDFPMLLKPFSLNELWEAID